MPASAPEALLAGRYRLVKVIAAGGMGVVWEAWDERLERAVAIKQLHALPGVPEAEAELAKDRAMREARITARLHHPHAVPVFDAVEHDGQPCLVMQLLPSKPLSAVLRDTGPMPLSQVARIGGEVASALAAAHQLGIVHRDVKPGNILITPDGRAHISDFGISHAMGDATLTRTGMIHGTPAYLAPEVARGQDASFPADVFSLGSTLYAALEGSPPFGSEGNSIALLHKVAAARVAPPTRAGSLTPFLLDMLSSEPDERPTMEAVARRLADLRTDDEPLEMPATVPLAAGASAAVSDPGVGVGSPAERELEDTHLTEREPELFWDERSDEVRDDRRKPADDGGVATQAPRRRSPWILLAGAGLVVALVWMLAGLFTDDEPRDTAGSDRGTSAQTTPTTQPTTSNQADPTTAAPTTAAPSTEPEPSASATPSATTASPTSPASPSPAAPNQATRLSSAITSYYALLPGDTAASWPLLTAAYQSRTAGGQSSYEAFWGDINDVAVSDVEASPPDRVVATVTYSRDGGRVDVERTSFRLVDEGGRLKIAGSEVLSSRRS